MLLIEAASKRFEREHNARAWLAWHTAYFQRLKKMPPLKKFFLNDTSKPRQTWRQQLAVMSEWATRHNMVEAKRQRLKEMTDGR